jgi:hypothetical protein
MMDEMKERREKRESNIQVTVRLDTRSKVRKGYRFGLLVL